MPMAPGAMPNNDSKIIQVPHTSVSQSALPPKREIQAASPALDANGRPPRTPGTGGRKA